MSLRHRNMHSMAKPIFKTATHWFAKCERIWTMLGKTSMARAKIITRLTAFAAN